MNVLWISGWGIPPERFRELAVSVFPNDIHTVAPPDPDAKIFGRRTAFDRIGGYSLGAFLLLREESVRPSGRPLFLLAPFFAFPAEAKRGGKIRRAQVRRLRHRMERNPMEALRDFHTRYGLEALVRDHEPPYARETLLRGLEILERDSLEPLWPERAAGIVGDDDPLVDTAFMTSVSGKLRAIAGANHHPGPLLKALAEIWRN